MCMSMVLLSVGTPADSYPIHTTTIDGAETWMCCTHHTLLPIPRTPQVSIFNTYLNTLDYWESSLLDNVTVYQPIHAIAQLWSQGSAKLVIASDGSASKDDNIMTFSWKMVTCSEEPPAEHSGLAFGQATLFQSEGY
eukprot:6768372-Ditylum_brightwellii.AAC.1